jgi:hypothetical protein
MHYGIIIRSSCQVYPVQSEGVRRLRLGSWWIEGGALRSVSNIYCRNTKLIASPSTNGRVRLLYTHSPAAGSLVPPLATPCPHAIAPTTR